MNNSKYIFLMNTSKSSYHSKERIPPLINKFSDKCTVLDIFGFESDDAGQVIHEMNSEELVNYFSMQDCHSLCVKLSKRLIDLLPTHVLFFTAGELMLYYTPVLSELLRNAKITVGCVLGDDEFLYKKNRFYLSLFDFVVSYTKAEYEKYKQHKSNVFLHPIGIFFSENDISNSDILNNDYINETDVVFIGRPYGTRATLIEYLINNGVKTTVYGNSEWLNYPIIAPSYGGFIQSAKYNDALRSSKIVLSFMEYLDGIPHINSKVFDAAKVQRMTIATSYEPFGYLYGLVEGESICTYSNKEDLLKKIKYYIENEFERTQIAHNMSNVLRKSFCYDQLYAKLFNDMDDVKYVDIGNTLNSISIVVVKDFEFYNSVTTKYPNCSVHYLAKCDKLSFSKLLNSCNPYLFFANREVDYPVYLLNTLNHAASYGEDVYTFNSCFKGRVLRKSRYLTDTASILIKKEKAMSSRRLLCYSWMFASFFGKITMVDVPINTYRYNDVLMRIDRLNKLLKKVKRGLSVVKHYFQIKNKA